MWAGAGLGPGAFYESEDAGEDDAGGAAAGVLYASYRTGAHVFSLRTTASGEIWGDSVADVGVLYSRATAGQQEYASFGIGLAVVFVDYNPDGLCIFHCPSDGRDDSVRTIGVPLEVQLFWRPLSFLGLGVYGFANINPEASFAGAAIGLQLGDLR